MARVIIYLYYLGPWLVDLLDYNNERDYKTIEIVFLNNESRTKIISVSESQSQNMIILGRSLPNQ
jgi:hypothetical protein